MLAVRAMVQARSAWAAFADLLPDMAWGLGPDHPDTLTTRNNLAFWRGRCGKTPGRPE